LSGLRSSFIMSAGLEVISAFSWFEYGRAGIEGGEQAGHGSFGDFSQEGLQLGIGLLDRVHVGAVGWQLSQLAPDRFDNFLALGSLVLDRLSMTTMSPFESVGARHFSTH